MSDDASTYVVLLAGGIGSGKSTVARMLEEFGATRIDLDRLSREVLATDATVVGSIAVHFGEDVLDRETGQLDRRLLAERAFATPEATALLEKIELPAIRARLREELSRSRRNGDLCCVVEVPLLDRLDETDRAHADEVLLVDCPYALRRARAVSRGMTAVDFDARAARQADDEWLRAHADTVIVNDAGTAELEEAVRAWWDKGLALMHHRSK